MAEKKDVEKSEDVELEEIEYDKKIHNLCIGSGRKGEGCNVIILRPKHLCSSCKIFSRRPGTKRVRSVRRKSNNHGIKTGD